MKDHTRREAKPGQPGAERFFCVWPGCEWWVDHHLDDFVAVYGDLIVARITEDLAAAKDHTEYIQRRTEALVSAYGDHVDLSLKEHLDAEHPGWTMEALLVHAKAYGIVELMHGFAEGDHDDPLE